MADVMSPHGNATGLGDKDAEQTRLCDQCGRWDHLSYVRKLGGLSICRWCQPVDPSETDGETPGRGSRRGTSAPNVRLLVSQEPYRGRPEDYIGCCVERHFPGYGLYQGTVTDYSEETDLFKVRSFRGQSLVVAWPVASGMPLHPFRPRVRAANRDGLTGP